MLDWHAGARREDQKKQKEKASCTGGASTSKAVMSSSGAEADLSDTKAPSAANDPIDAKVAIRQLESSEPAEANGPLAEPTADTSLPAGRAAAGDVEADALPTGTKVKANGKNKRKHSRAAAAQPLPDESATPPKRKHKSRKVWLASSVSGFPFISIR